MARRAGFALIANLLLLAAAPCGVANSGAQPIDALRSPEGSGSDALYLGAANDSNGLHASQTAASADDCGDCGGGGGGGQGDTGPERSGTPRSGALDLWALGVLAALVTSAARGRLTHGPGRRG